RDVGHRLALGVLVPGPRLLGAERTAGLLRLGDAPAGRLGGPLGGRLADAQVGQLGQDLLGGLSEAGLHAGQADDLIGGRGQVVLTQAQDGVQRAGALVASGTIVIVTTQAEGPQQGQRGTAAEALAAGVGSAMRAGHAGAPIPLFLRPSRAAWRALAPRRWTASRTSNSVLPRSLSSGLAASRRARRRASSRKGCWRVSKRRWASASWSGVRSMRDSFAEQFLDAFPCPDRLPDFPPTYEMLTPPVDVGRILVLVTDFPFLDGQRLLDVLVRGTSTWHGSCAAVD